MTASPSSPPKPGSTPAVNTTGRRRKGVQEGAPACRSSAPPDPPPRTGPKTPVLSTVPAQVIVVRLDDPEVERIGFGPDGIYFEYCILPLIGPTCCLLYRHVAPLILVADRAEVDLADLAGNLGLGTNIGPNSAVAKALARLQAFHIGAWRPDNEYALRRAVAPLADRQAQRLPRLARTIHFHTVISGLLQIGLSEANTRSSPPPGRQRRTDDPTGGGRLSHFGSGAVTGGVLGSGRDGDRRTETCVPRRFHLGQLIAMPKAVAAAHAAGINVVTVVLRHLGGDWGDVDLATRQHNDSVVATSGCLQSFYRLYGVDDAL